MIARGEASLASGAGFDVPGLASGAGQLLSGADQLLEGAGQLLDSVIGFGGGQEVEAEDGVQEEGSAADDARPKYTLDILREEQAHPKHSTPLPSEYGTCKTVRTRCWPRLSGKSPANVLWCSFLDGVGASDSAAQVYLTESVYKVVLQKSISAQIRRRILYYY